MVNSYLGGYKKKPLWHIIGLIFYCFAFLQDIRTRGPNQYGVSVAVGQDIFPPQITTLGGGVKFQRKQSLI